MTDVLDRLSTAQGAAFGKAADAARHVLRRRFRLLRLVRASYRHATSHEKGVARIRADLNTLIRMAAAWARREYTVIPWRALLYIVGALIYFVNPLDLIPDALVGIGFVDDAAVVAAVVRALRKEIDAFTAWELRPSVSTLRRPKRAA